MGNKNIKVNSKSSKCEEEELRRTVLKKKKNRPLSACFMKPVSFNQNSNSDNKFIKQSKSDYGIKLKEDNNKQEESEEEEEGGKRIIKSSKSSTSIKTFFLNKIQKKVKKNQSLSSNFNKSSNKDISNSTPSNGVIRSTTDYNLLKVTDNCIQMVTNTEEEEEDEEYEYYDDDDAGGNNEISTFKTRFVKSPALYNIQEVDKNNSNLLISDLLNHENSMDDSISIINGSINYFIEQQPSTPPLPQPPIQIPKKKAYENDNILNKPELNLLNEVTKKLTIYKTNLLEQSYFYYGNTKPFDTRSSSSSPSSLSKFSVSSIFISSQAPLAASECTTLTTNSSYSNLTKIGDISNPLQIYTNDDNDVDDYINIDF